MKLARYMGSGIVEIVDEPIPECPPGGLLVKTEACGLCSGELMDWYMDRKIPHVLGHEVAGLVVESQNSQFNVGDRIFAHHHAPCMQCELCLKGLYVHCGQWQRTKLVPGGMAEFYGVPADNLSDAFQVVHLRAVDAALIEPVACVAKSINAALIDGEKNTVAVIGLGTMGLMHCLLAPSSIGVDLNENRVRWAKGIGLDARLPSEVGGTQRFDRIFVCPGSQAAFDYAIALANPGARIVMFAPLPPSESLSIPQIAYFRDIEVAHCYSCGPDDTRQAETYIASGVVRAEQVVSDFIAIEDLPAAYGKMKTGEILKPMVVFQ